ncbi:NAD(P)-binding protein [Pseudobdellovibrio exovorus]|uniref:Amine oxidase domain-containing protein n=1 Tax=Pseudobdellovibrio exovorus JSS TaxID=1184267 RepID=M4V596_9BACT|nr:FAD/NAD(P)-binding protein [Pseudobdellovibrio exovorus]AGH94358.1 hypothetical protein A11Q_138 [Pseudobdellovibrio exovorus JSS]
MHIYDYIIIGSGLTGLTIAKKISQETENILILEAQDVAGGDNRPANLNGQSLDNGLRFFPATEASRQALGFLEDLLGHTVTSGSKENTVETYEASGFKDFVGFGDKSPEFYDQLSYFLSQEVFTLTQTPYQWMQSLVESLKTKIQTRSIVTRFGFEGLDSEKPVLTHVMVNGTKQLYAKNFIFAGPIKDLGLLIPDDVLNARAKAKLKKSTAWQAVCVDLFHTAPVEKENMFLLNGTTDDDIGPCIGRFLPAVTAEDGSTSGQISQWMSFVDSDSAEDTENIGLVLKKIKRQIKRAFPEVSDSVQKERIFVSPALSGADLKLNANLSLPKVENLWIASTQASRYANLLGSLMQAQLVLSALGFVTNTLSLAEDVSSNEADI